MNTVAAAQRSNFDEILLLVGKLNYTWTNTESLFIHLIAGLTKVDKEVATIIFLTLNTTRARIDLVQRVSKTGRVSDECRNEILQITSELARLLKIKNHFNHCIYSFAPDSSTPSTMLMRIFESKKQIKYGKSQKIDKAEFDNMSASVAQMEALNRDIWKLVLKYKFPV